MVRNQLKIRRRLRQSSRRPAGLRGWNRPGAPCAPRGGCASWTPCRPNSTVTATPSVRWLTQLVNDAVADAGAAGTRPTGSRMPGGDRPHDRHRPCRWRRPRTAAGGTSTIRRGSSCCTNACSACSPARRAGRAGPRSAPCVLVCHSVGEVAVEVDAVGVGPPVGGRAVGVGRADQPEVEVGRQALRSRSRLTTRSPACSSPWMLPMMRTFVRAPRGHRCTTVMGRPFDRRADGERLHRRAVAGRRRATPAAWQRTRGRRPGRRRGRQRRRR